MAPFSSRDNTQHGDDEEEEDYMSMVIEEPQQPRKKETLTQMRLRKQRESEAKGRVPSKKEREAEEAKRREEALSKSTLDPSNKGFKMMEKLGYKPGTALGRKSPEEETAAEAAQRRLLEPIAVTMKEDRGGIGMDTEKKRKIREQFESEAKRAKADESEYWERVRREREERRQEGQFHAAQKIIEGLETENAGEKEDDAEDPGNEPASKKQKRSRKPLSEINILYRGLVYSRLEEEREKKARREALSRSSAAHNLTIAGLPVPDESELDADDKLALGHDGEALRHVAEEKEEDEELEEFNALPPFERLSKAVLYLREKYYYCFWCKYRYENADMEGCPGLTEEDHD